MVVSRSSWERMRISDLEGDEWFKAPLLWKTKLKYSLIKMNRKKNWTCLHFFSPSCLYVIDVYVPQIISRHTHWAQDRLEVHVGPTASLRACVAYVLKEAVGSSRGSRRCGSRCVQFFIPFFLIWLFFILVLILLVKWFSTSSRVEVELSSIVVLQVALRLSCLRSLFSNAIVSTFFEE